MTEEDVNNYYSHNSTPVMLAGKEAHKQMLKKLRANWWETLDDSDSDGDFEAYDENLDELKSNIRNLNFDAMAEKHNKNGKSSQVSSKLSKISNCVSRRQNNQLKTNNLRRSVTYMMNCNPDKSRIWNVESDKVAHLN